MQCLIQILKSQLFVSDANESEIVTVVTIDLCNFHCSTKPVIAKMKNEKTNYFSVNRLDTVSLKWSYFSQFLPLSLSLSLSSSARSDRQ